LMFSLAHPESASATPAPAVPSQAHLAASAGIPRRERLIDAPSLAGGARSGAGAPKSVRPRGSFPNPQDRLALLNLLHFDFANESRLIERAPPVPAPSVRVTP
jgi:hypothetical protein